MFNTLDAGGIDADFVRTHAGEEEQGPARDGQVAALP
jgi:hypothetical protein